MEGQTNLENIEKFDIMDPSPINDDTSTKSEKVETKTTEGNEEQTQGEGTKKRKCKFPTAYSVLLIIQVLVYILTFIIPKGRYATIFYEDGYFYYTPAQPDEEIQVLDGTQETLDDKKVKISLETFKDGHIKKPVAIPGTYEKISGHNAEFSDLFLNPILGMIESADISFFVMILGGTLNVLVEMKALTNGLHALSALLKGRGFILLCIIMVLVSIGGTTFGMAEETIAFYPILMPIFLKNGVDGMLGTMSMMAGSLIGTMFSTVNAFAVVIASYSAGITFSDGIVFRVIGLIIGDILTCGYFYLYHRRVQIDETRSTCYRIKKKLEDKFLKEEEDEEKGKDDKNEGEEAYFLKKQKEKLAKQKETEFTLIQKVALIIFLIGFIIMIIGVSSLDWWFNEMTAVFLVIGIVLMLLLRKEEEKAVQVFTKGVGDFATVSLIIGLARGVNITLEGGLVSDTILHSLSDTLGDMNKVSFSIVMIFIFLILGFFIQSSSGLAVLSMPIFAPLAEQVHVSRTLIVNAYMFAQNFIGFISPTGLLLIILQMTGVPFNLWVKFIWPYMIGLFIYILILIMINSAL